MDGFDFLTFADCFNGSNRPPLPGCLNPAADFDGDGDVDDTDGLVFKNCYNGSDKSPRCLPQSVLVVDARARGVNNGRSWTDAYINVQSALAAAESGDEIWVAAGTYVECITLKDGVGLYGGFTGNETDRSQRNWTVNKTILDGNQQGSVITAPQGATEPTQFDGFTIRNGNGTRSSGLVYRYGGGIYCYNSSPTIANNTFTGNRASYGGGIYCDQCSPTITNNTITGNSADYGGGISCSNSSPMISNSIITENSASSDGGGIWCDQSSPTITNNSITGNSATGGAYKGGGGIYCDQSSPTITNNSITGNSASSDGGGIYCYYSSPTIGNNTITGNSATGIAPGGPYHGGGGIWCVGSSPTIGNNTITGNIAPSGGGIYCVASRSPTIANNTIATNSGGGIRCGGSSPTVINNTIAANSGSGIWCYGSSSRPTIANNTITGNRADYGGGIYCDYYSSPVIANTIIAFNSSGIYKDVSGNLTLRHNCVYRNGAYNYSGTADPTGTDGNLSVDPQLGGHRYGSGNWHIQPASPCVNAGDNGSVYGELDLDGQPRIQPQGGTVDMGADESDSTEYPEGPNVIVRVAPEGNDGNDGANWTAAKRTVQAGIDAAGVLGGEVWVKAGTYLERITLRPFAHVYGGFRGDETQKNQRDFRTEVTIVDGQQGASVVRVTEGHGVSTIDGLTIKNGSASYGGGIYCSSSSPTIANTTLAGNIASSGGGGIYCSSSSLTVANTILTGNIASSGGGIYCSDSSPTIANTTLTGNGASSGGGIHCSNSSPTIANTIIAFNSSGVYRSGTGDPRFRYNCVYGNSAYSYSGISDPTGADGNLSVDPRLAGPGYDNWHIQPDSPCVDAGDNGYAYGEVDLEGQPRILPQGGTVDIGADESDGTAWPERPKVIVRVALEGNDANEGSSWTAAKRTVQAGINAVSAWGEGEVWVEAGAYGGNIVLKSGVALYGGFAGNETERSQRKYTVSKTILDGQQGGSVVSAEAGQGVSRLDGFTITNGKADSGGGINCHQSSSTIANNVIIGNSASYGGGIYCSSSSPTITNNILTGNSASGSGGGICLLSSSPIIANNTITGNSVTGAYSYFNGGGIYCEDSSPTITNTIIAFNSSGIYKIAYDASAPTLRYSCVYGNAEYNYSGIDDPTRTEGNMSGRPFLSPDGHSRAGSPCIDAGDPDFVIDPNMLADIDGDPRIVNSRIDIGADEFLDTDEDGLPDTWESRYFESATAADPNADPDGEGLANLKEYEQYSSSPTAAPYYVDAVGGNDAYDGRTPAWDGKHGPKQTIQAGINDAREGDTVVVLPGSYAGTGNTNLDYGGKSVIVRSRDGLNVTVIDCGGDGRAVNYESIKGTSAVLEGFMVQDGKADGMGGAIRIDPGKFILVGCILTGNSAPGQGGGVYCNASNPTIDGLTLEANSARIGDAGMITRSSVNLQSDLMVVAGTLVVRSSLFYGPGSINLAAGTMLELSGIGYDAPTVLRSNIKGRGSIVIPVGLVFEVEDGAVVDLSGGAGGNCANGCVAIDPMNWGTITVDGKLVVRGATIRNANVQVTLAEFSGGVDIVNNDIRLLETSTGYGGEFFVEGTSRVECNTIRSEGDRYLDLDPDPTVPPANRPTLCGNKIHVVIKEGILDSQGTLLELRGLDYDSGGSNNPTGASGAFPASGSPGFTADPSANWVLEELEIVPGAKLNLTNRPGFQFQTDTTHPETVYVKNLILHEDAVLNTALQTLYYENLVQHPTSRIVDEPLLGFSLGIIAMNDPTVSPFNEFDIRVRTRIRDPQDVQPQSPPFKEGSIERLPAAQVEQEIPGFDTGGGVMDMRTQAPDKQSASSVSAKGAFARAGDEDIVIKFEYLFRQADANTKLIIYLSDKPDVGANLVKVAELRPPPASLPGGTASTRFATFLGRFPKGALNFTRGTYVELELRGAGSRVWIDDFDPQVWCQGICANFDVNPGIDDGDYLILLAEGGRPLPSEKGCLDISGDGYVDLSDVLAWDVVYNTTLNLCPEQPANLVNRAMLDAVEGPKATDGGTGYNFLVAGKKGDDDSTDLLATISEDGVCTGSGQPPACSSGDCTHGNARLVQDAAGTVYLVHGVYGLLRRDTGAAVVSPRVKTYQGSAVRVGVLTDEDIPLSDATFAPGDVGPQHVYVLPVRVTAPDGHTYKGVAKLQLLGGGDYNVAALFGIDPAGDSDPCVNASTSLPGGRVLPLCDLSGIRELEMDSLGNLFVASATGYNDNDWVLIYNEASGNPGFEAARVNLNTLFEGQGFPVPAGPGALRFSTHFPNTLYLASMVNASNGLVTRVYRFAVQRSGNMATGLTFTGAVEIDSANAPPDICGQITCTDYVSGINAIQEAPDGTLYVIGFTAPKFAENDPLPVSEMFTTPTMGVILWNATWSTVSATVTVIPAAKITSCDLALPLSAVLMMAPCNHPPSDLDGDTDVDGFDFLTFANCYNGSNRPALLACATPYADLDRDCDVDGFDFLTFANCYNGANRPPLCP